MPAVATDLVDRQFVGGFHEWGTTESLLQATGLLSPVQTARRPSMFPDVLGVLNGRPDGEQPPTTLEP